MENTRRTSKPNPYTTAGIFSRLFFSWVGDLFKYGYKNGLEVQDMYDVLDEDSSSYLAAKLEREWRKELRKLDKGETPAFRSAIIRTFGLGYLLLGFFATLEDVFKILQPVFLGKLLLYFTTASPISQLSAYLYAGAICLCSIGVTILHHPYFFRMQRIGMQARVACCSLIYRKSLRLSNEALGQTTTGQIVNLLSNDVNRFDQIVIFLHFLWLGPLQTLAVVAILWYELGPSSVAGFAVLVLLLPCQTWMGKIFSKLRLKTAVQTDERVRIMNEIISGMRVIKMYCWEIPFGKVAEKIRSTEISRIMESSYARAFNMVPYFAINKLIVFITFITFVLLGNHLTATKIFLTISLYNSVRLAVTLFFPFGIQVGSEVIVCCTRIQTFLLMDELDPLEQSRLQHLDTKSCGIYMDNVSATWNKPTSVDFVKHWKSSRESEKETLNNINLEVTRGKLVAVIGPVGSGKSSLIMTILGELINQEGTIKVKGQVAYASQSPWIFSGSLRQNITFGHAYDETQYNKVIKACDLTKDLELLPHGDRTLVGERGVSLSGGQKARVSLARTLYMDAEIYLLDDPLSAVDAKVGRHLFENCIMGMLKSKAKLLVTHQLQYLTQADEIIILKEGKIDQQGTYEELARSGIDFASLMKTDEEEDVPPDLILPSSKSLSLQSLGSGNSLHVTSPSLLTPDYGLHRRSAVCGNRSPVISTSMLSVASMELEYMGNNEPTLDEGPSVQKEEISQGTVGWRVYVDYIRAGAGLFKCFLLVLLNVLVQGVYILSDWWLAYWSKGEEEKQYKMSLHNALLSEGHNITNITVPISAISLEEHIYIFTGITFSVFLFGILRALLVFNVCIVASETLHKKMFSGLLRAPIYFFDNNPVGRILNRFSKDVGQTDDLLPFVIYQVFELGLLVLGIFIVVAVTNPWIILPIIPLLLLFFYTRNYYLQTSRDVKRLEGTTRSPVFSHLSATLQGLSTIRSYKAQEAFIDEFDSHQDVHSQAWFLFLVTTRWFAVRLDWICCLFIISVTFCCLLAKDNMQLESSVVGLSLTYALMLMGMFQWTVRQTAEAENQMTSVERIMEYGNLKPEAPLETDVKPPNDWPKHGIISGENVSFAYSEDSPRVLKNLYFCIRAKEKVGIVGRTGAGKSSFIQMLFRTAEPTGKLLIDGVDISDLGLHDLRRHISIIPQDPVLFTGTIRKNLDPFNLHNDVEIWDAIEQVQLKPAIEDLPEGLQSEVSEGGSNFSIGQKQLLCLARAILKRNKILVIDEATANVDPKTDSLIQVTIRERFRLCTVLTIAHRLHTIMDSDRVLVLDEGRIKEFEEPYILLQNKNSSFYKLTEQTGDAECQNLIEIAKVAYEGRTSNIPWYKDSEAIDDSNRSHLNSYIPSGHTGPIQLETLV